MAIQTIYDTGSDYPVTSKMDGGIYSLIGQDCVIKGIGDEMTIQSNSNSFTVTFKAGSQAFIGGSFFKVTSDTILTLTSTNSTYYICARIEPYAVNGSKGKFVALTSESQIQNGNLNGGDEQRDLLLYSVTTDSNGVSAVTDRRVVKESNQVSISGISIWIGTETEYNALASHDSNTLYFIKGS